jgi:type IV pilus assembly protein PilB
MRESVASLVLSRGLATDEDLREAEALSRKARMGLVDALVSLRKISAEEAADLLAEHYGLERVSGLESARPAAEVPAELARRHRVFPVKVEGGVLCAAMDDPANVEAVDALRLATGMNVVPLVCTPREMDAALKRWYGDGAPEEVSGAEEEPAEAAVVDSPAVRLVREILEAALAEGASDVHVEPGRGRTRVRLRVDGRLRHHSEHPAALHGPVVSRLKVMAGLDITERRAPQDGRIRLSGPREADFRVSVLPTVRGEKVVLRVFDRMRKIPRLEELGYGGAALGVLRRALAAPSGMVLVTGPTGSGKTTTLYAALSEVLSGEVNAVTVEDPPEYELSDVCQVAVNPRAGLGFAAALRSILRQDPDIIMVGEIRDGETARVAVQAALTGHLVLSTLHTNDAASAPVRLVDMGAEPYLVASALLCVASQRLVRLVCPRCRETVPLDPDRPAFDFMASRDLPGVSARGRGCPRCGGTGYRGRTAIAEVMPVSRGVRELVRRKAAADEVRDLAVAEGMVPLAEEARRRAAAGEITADDALRASFGGWD